MPSRVQAEDELAEALSAATHGPMRRPARWKSDVSAVRERAQKPMASRATR